MTDAAVLVALSDAQALGLTMFGEARGDLREGGSSVEERIAVGCVVRNRVAAKRWGADVKSTCLQPKQFSCWNADGSANYREVIGAAHQVVAGALDEDLRECLFLASGVIGAQLRDRVNGATHYVTGNLYLSNPPMWLKGKTPCAQVGSHVFFKGPGL